MSPTPNPSPYPTPAPAASAAPRAAYPPARLRRAGGYGIVEIMLALVLGMVVIGALGQLYSGSVSSQKFSQTLAQVNETGRFLVDFLSSDLRMAGYLSCGGPEADIGNSLNNVSDWRFVTGGMEGFEGGVDTPPQAIAAAARAGSDVLIVRRAAVDQGRGLIAQADARGPMEIGGGHGFAVGEVLVAADPRCNQASVFQVTAVVNVEDPDPMVQDGIEHSAGQLDPGNCTDLLFGDYDCTSPGKAMVGTFMSGSTVSRYLAHAYYITASDPPSLARQRLGHAGGNAVTVTETLAQEVEDFQVEYGLNTDKDPARIVDEYVTADEVTNWSEEVVGVRFALLVRSHQRNVRTEPRQEVFELPGRTVTGPEDRRIRRIFGNVVQLRNVLQ